MFTAHIAFVGCLPEGDAPAPTFQSAQDAWEYLLTTADDLAYVPQNEDDPHGPHVLSPLGVAINDMTMGTLDASGRVIHSTGTVYAGSLGYTVEHVEPEDDHPEDCRYCAAGEGMVHTYEPPSETWIVEDWMGQRIWPTETFDSFQSASDRIMQHANDTTDNEDDFNGVCEDLYAERA